MGIIGGRVIFMEDFESLITHYDITSPAFSITTTPGTVWDGDAAGQLTLPTGAGASYFAEAVQPTPDILSVEVMFKPGDAFLANTSLQYYIYDGKYQSIPTVEITTSAGGLLLRIRDATGALKTVASFTDTTIAQRYHLLYMRFNLGTYLYELAQFDGKRILLQGQEFYHVVDTTGPYTYLQVYAEAAAGHGALYYFDNLVLAYEEL